MKSAVAAALLLLAMGGLGWAVRCDPRLADLNLPQQESCK